MAVRKGEWKITKAVTRRGQARPGQARPGHARRGRGRPGEGQLYNLVKDIGEKTDAAAENPAVVKELTDAWEKWNAELMAPHWQRAAGPTANNAGARKKS